MGRRDPRLPPPISSILRGRIRPIRFRYHLENGAIPMKQWIDKHLRAIFVTPSILFILLMIVGSLCSMLLGPDLNALVGTFI